METLEQMMKVAKETDAAYVSQIFRDKSTGKAVGAVYVFRGDDTEEYVQAIEKVDALLEGSE